MVSLKRATTSCVVQKEKTQTRITFNNLSADLTVDDLYKYVQLHLEEEGPFQLSLVTAGQSTAVDQLESAPKTGLDDKRQTLLAAGLSFEDDAANTVLLISTPGTGAVGEYVNLKPTTSKTPTPLNGNGNGVKVIPSEPTMTDTPADPKEETMEVPEKAVESTPAHNGNGNGNGHTHDKGGEEEKEELKAENGKENGNGNGNAPEELQDFSRQININTNLGTLSDDDPAPMISPIDLSPAGGASSANGIPDPPPLPALEYPSIAALPSTSTREVPTKPTTKFVGLVNQAMTCYLNSLLQALYMTPEFRNALYNWEFDGNDESKSIPYQLQRLFLNLQTSEKSAVETTDLTRSFGWDSSEAWQQHDIQELCRVMFDALEHKFKDTKESNLINRLYEGKMIDYLKCLNCGTEKQREDTFLDIPLPVKPFGNSVAFGSVEEALRAFIQPEILNGNNQYNCEKCAKKCDAHKGLKFSKFPYILTLHLKRFDFDYQTFHRIKLNDKVTFPQTLNLNGFLNTATDFPSPDGDDEELTTGKNGHSSHESNGDETAKENGGVNGESSNGTSNGTEEEAPKNGSTFGSHSGPNMYELFAIMIHSGSASGGHYYVYIKDFDSGNWLCFNDQTVSPITQEDIQKSFGGNAGRYNYSSAYTTSTNAYMLMFRQIDPTRNKAVTKAEEFPEHIAELQKRLKDRPDVDTRRRNTTDCGVITTRVYHYDRERCKLTNVKIHISGDYYLDELLQRAYDRMSLATLKSLSMCRLVAFDSSTEQIVASFDSLDQTLLQSVLDQYPNTDFLLEERERDRKFKKYSGRMINARVFIVSSNMGDVQGPYRVPLPLSAKLSDIKEELKNVLNSQCAEPVRVAVPKGDSTVILQDDDQTLEKILGIDIEGPVKLFVAPFPKAVEGRVEKFDQKLISVVDAFDRVVSIYLKAPKITAETRKLYSLPEYEPVVPVVPVENGVKVVISKPEPEDEVKEKEQEQEKKPEKENGLMENGNGKPETAPENPPIVEEGLIAPTPIRKDESPEPLSCVSNTESVSESSEKVPTKVKKTGVKKSPTAKSSAKALGTGETTTEEKAVVKIVESFKEVTENGVTKKVRVIKRIVKKDPSKKTTATTATATGDKPENGDKPATVPIKTVKKVKAAAKPEETTTTTPLPQQSASVPEIEILSEKPGIETKKSEQPQVPESVVESVSAAVAVSTVPEIKPKEDVYAFLDAPIGESRTDPYFRVVENKSLAKTYEDDDSRVVQVHVDKDMTISALTKCLEPVLKVPCEFFKLNRSRTDALRLSELVSSVGDGEEILVELGRILQEGEYKYRVTFMNLSKINDFTEEFQQLCEFVCRNNQRVDEAKSGILSYLKETGNKVSDFTLPPNKYRLWTKLYQSLSQPCMDDMILGEDVSLRRNGEFVLEQLEEDSADPMSDADDYVIFIRKWNPDTLVLEPYRSLTLPLKSDLMKRISDVSGIAVEDLEYARNMAPFPKMKISRAAINGDMDWRSEPFHTSFENSRNGHVYFYRNKTVTPKEPTASEISSIQEEESRQRDLARAQNGSANQDGSADFNGTQSNGVSENGSSSYTLAKNRKKERGLKIYVDTSPAKVST